MGVSWNFTKLEIKAKDKFINSCILRTNSDLFPS